MKLEVHKSIFRKPTAEPAVRLGPSGEDGFALSLMRALDRNPTDAAEPITPALNTDRSEQPQGEDQDCRRPQAKPAAQEEAVQVKPTAELTFPAIDPSPDIEPASLAQETVQALPPAFVETNANLVLPGQPVTARAAAPSVSSAAAPQPVAEVVSNAVVGTQELAAVSSDGGAAPRPLSDGRPTIAQTPAVLPAPRGPAMTPVGSTHTAGLKAAPQSTGMPAKQVAPTNGPSNANVEDARAATMATQAPEAARASSPALGANLATPAQPEPAPSAGSPGTDAFSPPKGDSGESFGGGNARDEGRSNSAPVEVRAALAQKLQSTPELRNGPVSTVAQALVAELAGVQLPAPSEQAARPAAPSAPALAHPVQPIEVPESVVVRVISEVKSGGSATIELQHPTLGTIQLQLTVDRGAVVVQAVAASAAAMIALRGSEGALRASVARHGFELRALRVQLAPHALYPGRSRSRRKDSLDIDMEA